MLRWQDTGIGQQLVDAFDPNTILFLVIKDRDRYRELQNLNQDSSSCSYRWFPGQGEAESEGDTNSVSSVTTITSNDVGFGAIALSGPCYLHEKQKSRLPPWFLFGRKSQPRRVDVWLSHSKRSEFSRHHFGLRQVGQFWTSQTIDGKMIINDVFINKIDPPYALSPDWANILVVGGITLEVYCQPSRPISDMHLMDVDMPDIERSIDDSVTTSNTHTVNPAEHLGTTRANVYLLESRDIYSRNATRKTVAMDPWTCQLYVAKFHNSTVGIRKQLENRLQLLGKLPLSNFCQSPTLSFLPNVRLIEQDNSILLLSRFREDARTLFSSKHEIEQEDQVEAARRLLFSLLRLVSRLHGSGVVHNDICLHTVLVDDYMDAISVAGFSEATADMSRAGEDCRQLFRTVKDYLGPLASKVPSSWLGYEALEGPWSCCEDPQSWRWDACGLVENLGLSLDRPNELWTTIRFTKRLIIRLTSQQGKFYLNTADVAEYLRHDAVRYAGSAASRSDVAALCRNLLKTLEMKGNQIEFEDYCVLQQHMTKRHSNKIGGSLAYTPILKHQRSIPLDVNFRASFHPRYGLVNIWQLRHLAQQPMREGIFRPILDQCYELRGPVSFGGIYVSVSHFTHIITSMQLSSDLEYEEPDDLSLEDFTYENWYLLASNESSEIVPVARSTNEVHSSTSLGKFLQSRFDPRQYLDSVVAFKREALVEPDLFEARNEASCNGSATTPSEDDLQFRFSGISRSNPPDRTEDWVHSSTKRRRTADMQRTEFTSKPSKS